MLRTSHKYPGHWYLIASNIMYIYIYFLKNSLLFLLLLYIKFWKLKTLTIVSFSYKKGYILGNPITQIKSEDNSKIPYAHGMALISDELYEVWYIWYFLVLDLYPYEPNIISCFLSLTWYNNVRNFSFLLAVAEKNLQRKLWKCGFA